MSTYMNFNGNTFFFEKKEYNSFVVFQREKIPLRRMDIFDKGS